MSQLADVDKNINRELKVVILTSTGNLLLWQETDPQLCRCIYSKNRPIVVQQVAINSNEVIFVTNDGEAFQGVIKPRKKKDPTYTDKNKSEKGGFHKFLTAETCISIKLTKVSRIHRAVFIAGDPKGKDYCVIQVSRNNLIKDIIFFHKLIYFCYIC